MIPYILLAEDENSVSETEFEKTKVFKVIFLEISDNCLNVTIITKTFVNFIEFSRKNQKNIRKCQNKIPKILQDARKLKMASIFILINIDANI